jgi:hypothetical protein
LSQLHAVVRRADFDSPMPGRLQPLVVHWLNYTPAPTGVSLLSRLVLALECIAGGAERLVEAGQRLVQALAAPDLRGGTPLANAALLELASPQSAEPSGAPKKSTGAPSVLPATLNRERLIDKHEFCALLGVSGATFERMLAAKHVPNIPRTVRDCWAEGLARRPCWVSGGVGRGRSWH